MVSTCNIQWTLDYLKPRLSQKLSASRVRLNGISGTLNLQDGDGGQCIYVSCGHFNIIIAIH